jgi:L-lactate dehydrogenase complex protein LldG
MNANQTAFLRNIRAALDTKGHQLASPGDLFLPVDDSAAVDRAINRSQEERLALAAVLHDNAAPLGLSVHPCASPMEAAACVAAIAGASEPEYGTAREIVIHDHPLLQTLPWASLASDHGLSLHSTRHGNPEVRRHTISAYIGITAAAWAIAESATIVQLTRPGQPRSTSLVPSIHIAVLPLANLVATLEEALALVRREPDVDSLVLISGPSKTADIEAHMVLGAHGPRAMHLILLTGTASTPTKTP